jgi:hypothetical protein
MIHGPLPVGVAQESGGVIIREGQVLVGITRSSSSSLEKSIKVFFTTR